MRIGLWAVWILPAALPLFAENEISLDPTRSYRAIKIEESKKNAVRVYDPIPPIPPRPTLMMDSLFEEFYSVMWAPIQGLQDLVTPDEPDYLASRDELSKKTMFERILRIDIEYLHDPYNTNRVIEALLKIEDVFFRRFPGTYLNPLSFEEGLEDIEYDFFWYEQRKKLLNIMGGVFGEKFVIRRHPDRTLKQEGYDTTQWQRYDYAVMPTMLGVHAYLSGVERPISLFGLQGRIFAEPIYRLLGDHDGVESVAAAGLQIRLAAWVSLLGSVGWREGEFGVDFVGIATDPDILRKMLRLADPEKLQLKKK